MATDDAPLTITTTRGHLAAVCDILYARADHYDRSAAVASAKGRNSAARWAIDQRDQARELLKHFRFVQLGADLSLQASDADPWTAETDRRLAPATGGPK
jgi:hypothetical protein